MTRCQIGALTGECSPSMPFSWGGHSELSEPFMRGGTEGSVFRLGLLRVFSPILQRLRLETEWKGKSKCELKRNHKAALEERR